MIKKNWKLLLLTSVVILLSIFAGLFLWNRLPEQVPIHWNAAGEVDGWSNKTMAVFGMPTLMLAIQWLMVFALSADPKRQNHSQKVLYLAFWLIPVLNTIVMTITYGTAMGGKLRVEVLLPVLLGLPFVGIGNYLPKCQQNYTIGIKIPWTLNSEENWNKTHRVAGFVWVVGGLLMMLSGFFASFWPLPIVTLLMVLIPLIYSYVLHRKGV